MTGIIGRLSIPRFYPILDTGLLATRGMPPETAAEALLEGGARILQFRHKTEFSRSVFNTAERISELCHRAGALFVINDRADMAQLLGAALHLGQDDLPPSAARRLLGEARWIGFSTHNEQQLRHAASEPANYVAIGPLFTTGSKQNPDPVVGLEQFQKIRPIDPRPCVAIGGITRERARDTLAAGADSLAVIADLFPEELTKISLRARTEEWVQLLQK